MTFLNPLVLLGLAAAAIPLIIHLFNFRRPRKIDFSSLAFLKELQKSTMQRVRIKQLLLLVLRTLAIACLVLAFARPTLTREMGGNLGGQAASSIALVLDNTRSMQMRDGQGAYWDQARDFAASVVEQMGPGDELYVVPVGRARHAEQQEVYDMKHLALEAIDDIEIVPGSGTIVNAWMRAARQLNDASHLNREIYVISDFQRSALVDTNAFDVPDNLRTYLVPLGTRDHANVAVTEVDIVSRIIEAGQSVRITATLVNHSEEPLEGYVASVFLEGERVAQASVDLSPGVPGTAEFTVTPQRTGWLSGVVEIEDDAFTTDNIRHFTLHVPETRQLLIVRGDEQNTDFIELALSPALSRGRVAFELERIEEGDLPVKRLGSYDAVALVGLRSISSGESASLREYVEEGGGVLFFPGQAGLAEDYNAVFGAFGAGEFSGFSGTWLSRQSIASFDQVDLEHPLFEGVFEQQQEFRQQISVETPMLYYTMNYTPGSQNEQTLIQMSNGFPFLQEIRHGQGALFLFSVAPDTRWSDLPQKGLFVPLLYRSMYYLSSGDANSGDPLVVGQTHDLRVAGVSELEQLMLIAPNDEEFVPEQRNLFGAALLQIDESLQLPGIYEIVSGDQLMRKIALNLDVRESDLSTYDPAEARERFENITAQPARVLNTASAGGVERILEDLREERTGKEIWNVFLLLALIFLICEMLVARQWRPESVPA